MRVGPDDEGTGAAFEAAVAAVAALDPAPDAVLLSGDLAEHADPREYERVRSLLAPLSMPVHFLPGNHDDPTAVPAWYAVQCGSLRLVACDSTVPGADSGSFGPERLERLEQLLAEDPRTPTVVAMHHPPIDIGVEDRKSVV